MKRFAKTLPASVRSCRGLLGLLVLAGGPGTLPASAAPSTEAVLRDLNQAERTVAYTATETIQRAGSSTVRLRVQRSGRKQRFDYLAPEVRRGDAIIDDGRVVWIYLRGENSAVQTVSRPDREYGTRPGRGARVAGVGTVDDRIAWIIELSRGDNQRRLWVDQKNGALLRREMRRNGRIVENSVLSGIRFGAVPTSVFAWKPPTGAEVTRTRGTLYVNANSARRIPMLKFPSWIPGGYAFESAIVDEESGEAWLRFSGAHRFSIFQSRGQSDAALRQVNGAWFVARGGNRFVIVGLNEADARRLAASL